MTIILYPTDTIYGLGCPINDKTAVKKVFEIKKRGFSMPLSVAFSDIKQMMDYVDVDEKQLSFIKENWNKGTTFIVKKKNSIPNIITANSENVGARIPDHDEVRKLTKKFGPIITTSANVSGKPAPVRFEELDKEIVEKADLIIKGECPFKKASVIYDLTKEPYEIIRY